jgi:hypothetical protein
VVAALGQMALGDREVLDPLEAMVVAQHQYMAAPSEVFLVVAAVVVAILEVVADFLVTFRAQISTQLMQVVVVAPALQIFHYLQMRSLQEHRLQMHSYLFPSITRVPH